MRGQHAAEKRGSRSLFEGVSATRSVRGCGMSMWLASACVTLHEACKVQAADLLATRSTTGRLERVLKVLKAEIAKKYSSPRGRQKS